MNVEQMVQQRVDEQVKVFEDILPQRKTGGEKDAKVKEPSKRQFKKKNK